MVLGNFLRNQRFGTAFKIVLISFSVITILTISYVPKKISSLRGDDIRETTQTMADSISDGKLGEGASTWKKVPTHREKGNLPDFSNGGIVIFYHIYKTGGSTVGKLLHELAQRNQKIHIIRRYKDFNEQDIESTEQDTDNDEGDMEKAKFNVFKQEMESPATMFFTMIRKHIDWEQQCVSTLDLASTKKKLVLLELHVEDPAPEFASLVELAPTIDRWRAEADRRGVGFFAFTLVREPVAHALSFFNFFHVGNFAGRPPPTRFDHDFWNPFKPLAPTEKEFLRSYYAKNRQCRMLHSDPQSTYAAPQRLVWKKHKATSAEIAELHQPCEINKVYDTFIQSLDWVGTTENLQNETLPLLTKIVANDPSIGRKNKPFKVYDNIPNGHIGMKKYNLSNETMSIILERTELDRGLYADVVRNFKLTDLGWDYNSPKGD
mmetsp:Transcript_0/g.1  ORF Transcript_0/g.1 Transcript_0/m.1 type:complete len:435 (+) Transcript_0:114-1418(+)